MARRAGRLVPVWLERELLSSQLSPSILVQFIILIWAELVSSVALEVLMVVEMLVVRVAVVEADRLIFAPIPRWVPE
jgi:hypothetical protein